MPPSLSRRLLIVANRLPFSVTVGNGALAYTESPGGVASGLRAYLDALPASRPGIGDYVWVGWPGATVEEQYAGRLRDDARARFHSDPVLLSAEEMEKFYHGFCNRTIWPLFHYFPTFASFDEDTWRQYRRVNEIFCEGVLGTLAPGDIVWVHDYHLMLLPGLLRQRRRDLTVGFFLHIPFPSYEIFRLLPGAWREGLLEGMLGADLIGFHTYGYMQHFLQCILRLLGQENNMGVIMRGGRVVKAETFPMGIDFARFQGAAAEAAVRAEAASLAKSLAGARIILSVDRLDYTKGVLNRLRGYEQLLEENPGFRGAVALVMVLVPSRIGVEHYEQMKKQIEELVGKINGRFGTVGWTPVIYQYRSLPFAPLAALYRASDVALVTPLRDGMNLVAKEYVASRTDGTGVLVISEMAGAAKELGEAVVVNPHATGEIARALKEALEMPPAEQRRRNKLLRNRLRRYDVNRWANDFLDQLLEQKQVQRRFDAMVLPASARANLVERFARAERRLILLDYDGTLTPLVSRPAAASPARALLDLLRRVARLPRTTVALVSGRDRDTMQKWFGDLPVRLVAEHGVWQRDTDGPWTLLKDLRAGWKDRILPILERYMDRLPGAFIEEKEYSLAWHFRGGHPEQAEELAGELADHLMTFTANIDVQVVRGKKVIEVRSAGVHKGVPVLRWLGREPCDFILAVGDDVTDEDLFGVLPDDAFSIRVGLVNSRARYNLTVPSDVIALLEEMSRVRFPRLLSPEIPSPRPGFLDFPGQMP